MVVEEVTSSTREMLEILMRAMSWWCRFACCIAEESQKYDSVTSALRISALILSLSTFSIPISFSVSLKCATALSVCSSALSVSFLMKKVIEWI